MPSESVLRALHGIAERCWRRYYAPVVADNANVGLSPLCHSLKHRDALQEYLTQNGIGTMIHIPVPPHLQEAYSDKGWKQRSVPARRRNRSDVPFATHVPDV